MRCADPYVVLVRRDRQGAGGARVPLGGQIGGVNVTGIQFFPGERRAAQLAKRGYGFCAMMFLAMCSTVHRGRVGDRPYFQQLCASQTERSH